LMNPQLLSFLGESRPMFGLELSTFVNMLPNLVNLIVLALVMTYLLYDPVKNILKARSERVANEIKEAEKSNLSANELKVLYEKKVKDIELERATILDEARRQAKDKQAQILSEAKTEAQDVRDRASKDIAAERDQIKGAVCQAIVDISTDMAAKLIAATVDKNAHSKLFSEAMDELEATVFKPNSATA